MPDYQAFGRLIHSELDLPELPAAWSLNSEHRSLLRIDVCERSRRSRRGGTWIRHFGPPAERRWLSVGRCGNEHILRFPGLADFILSSDGTRVAVEASSTVSAPTIRHLLLDHVLPRCLARSGETVLHASAVLIDGRAVAFMGPTGSGKSTVAIALAEAGAGLLTDDCVVIRNGEVAGSYPGIRLWPGSIAAFDVRGPQTGVMQGSDKRRLTMEPVPGDAAPTGSRLREIHQLYTDDTPGVPEEQRPCFERMSGGAAFLAVLTHSFRLETGKKADLIAEADRVGRLASETAVFQLHLPSSLDALRASAGDLLGLLREKATS